MHIFIKIEYKVICIVTYTKYKLQLLPKFFTNMSEFFPCCSYFLAQCLTHGKDPMLYIYICLYCNITLTDLHYKVILES